MNPPVKRRVGVTALALLMAAGLYVVSSGGFATAKSDSLAAQVGADTVQMLPIKAAFSGAMTARQTTVVPNHGAGQIRALTAASSLQQVALGKQTLNRFFTPTAAAHEMFGVRNAAKAESAGTTQVEGGGVSNVTYKGVSVAGSTARVHAYVTIWSKFKVRQTVSGPWLNARPTNVLDAHAVMTEGPSGAWRVSSLTWDFVPGTGP